MEIIEITKCGDEISLEDIRQTIINGNQKVLIDYPLSYVNFSQSSLDIIHNYLEASYLAETLGCHATSISVRKIYDISYHPVCRYEIVAKDIDELAREINI